MNKFTLGSALGSRLKHAIRTNATRERVVNPRLVATRDMVTPTSVKKIIFFALSFSFIASFSRINQPNE